MEIRRHWYVGQVEPLQVELLKDRSNHVGEPLGAETLPIQATAAIWSSSDPEVFAVENSGPFALGFGVGSGDAVLTVTVPATIAGTESDVVESFNLKVYQKGTPGAVIGARVSRAG